MDKIINLGARILLAQLFLVAGLQKIPNYAGTQGYMEAMGVPGALLPLVIALEIGGAPVFGPDRIRLRPFTATYIYAVGDFAGGTFQYLVFVEDGLKAGRSGKGNDARPWSRPFEKGWRR